VGEETGNLDAMLSKVADFYEAEVAAAVNALTSILEPVMIILVGFIVGFIANLLIHPVNERFHEPTDRQGRFDRTEPAVVEKSTMERS